jgi:hypothetical protein
MEVVSLLDVASVRVADLKLPLDRLPEELIERVHRAGMRRVLAQIRANIPVARRHGKEGMTGRIVHIRWNKSGREPMWTRLFGFGGTVCECGRSSGEQLRLTSTLEDSRTLFVRDRIGFRLTAEGERVPRGMCLKCFQNVQSH